MLASTNHPAGLPPLFARIFFVVCNAEALSICMERLAFGGRGALKSPYGNTNNFGNRRLHRLGAGRSFNDDDVGAAP